MNIKNNANTLHKVHWRETFEIHASMYFQKMKLISWIYFGVGRFVVFKF